LPKLTTKSIPKRFLTLSLFPEIFDAEKNRSETFQNTFLKEIQNFLTFLSKSTTKPILKRFGSYSFVSVFQKRFDNYKSLETFLKKLQGHPVVTKPPCTGGLIMEAVKYERSESE
jgi:hypothetical protein